MYHIHRATPADFDAWALVPADDATETPEHPATDAELLNRGVRVLYRDASEVLYDCAWLAIHHDRQPCPKPGEIVSSGSLKARMIDKLPPQAQEKVLRARVLRRKATSLRHEVSTELGITVPTYEEAPPEAVAKGREKQASQTDTDSDPISEETVPLDTIESSDLVEDTHVFPGRWAGERDE